MKIENVKFNSINWNLIEKISYAGEQGQAFWKTIEQGTIRIRMVEYTAGYIADHWCHRGHVVLVLEGELITELKDGRKFHLLPGMSYQVSTDVDPHRSSTVLGAKIFIVD